MINNVDLEQKMVARKVCRDNSRMIIRCINFLFLFSKQVTSNEEEQLFSTLDRMNDTVKAFYKQKEANKIAIISEDEAYGFLQRVVMAAVRDACFDTSGFDTSMFLSYGSLDLLLNHMKELIREDEKDLDPKYHDSIDLRLAYFIDDTPMFPIKQCV